MDVTLAAGLTKSRHWSGQDFHRNAENVPRTFVGERQKCLKLEKIHSFSARDVAKFGRRRTKINSLNEKKVGYFEEIVISE